MRTQATGPLATFLDYITYSYMIDNIILLITGTLHQVCSRGLFCQKKLKIVDSHLICFTLHRDQSQSWFRSAIPWDLSSKWRPFM